MPAFGRIPAVDPRDQKFLMRRTLGFVGTVELPKAKTWVINGKSLDQGPTSTCVGHAWKNFLRSKPIMTDKSGPSQYSIYRRACQLDPWPDNDHEALMADGDPGMAAGTSVRAGAKVLVEATRIEAYMWAFGLEDVVNWVLTQGPVVIGSNWYGSMMDTDKDGMVYILPGSAVVGGHAYLLRGVNTNTALATFENSWGDNWGKHGMFYMPFETLSRLLAEQGEACAAVETYPKP